MDANIIKSRCPNPIGVAKNELTGISHEIGCGRWSCPVCAKSKKKRLLDRVRMGFNGQRVRHFVLTELKSSGSKHDEIALHWARLRASLAKHGYKHYLFFRSTEFEQRKCKKCREKCEWSGTNNVCCFDTTMYRHMHVMISTYIPKAVIEKLWEDATEGTAHIVRMRDHGFEVKNPAGYLAKYLGKGFADAPFEKGERRYSMSRNAFPKLYCTLPAKYTVAMYSPLLEATCDDNVMYCHQDSLELNQRWYPQYQWVVAPEKLLDSSYPTC